jgi:hypothetical protein
MSKKKTEESKEETKEAKSYPKFTCNVSFNNKEYAKGDEWKQEVPEAIKNFLE